MSKLSVLQIKLVKLKTVKCAARGVGEGGERVVPTFLEKYREKIKEGKT